MAVDMFLTLEGIKGESADKAFGSKNAIDVLAWSWGVSQSGTMHIGKGGGAGKASVQDVSITKYVDSASPDLILQCCNGKHITKGSLFVRKAGEKPLTYIQLDLEGILISSVSTGGSGGQDLLTENVTLNFAKVSFTYFKQKADGTGEKVGPVGWNVPENVKV